MQRRWMAGVLAVSCLTTEPVMAFPGSAYLFSSVDGVVTLAGKPLENAVVVRRYQYRGEHRDEGKTDASGRFSFPAVRRWDLSWLLPAEFLVPQNMVVVHQGQEYLIWSNTRRTRQDRAELGGLPLIIRCELTDEIRVHKEFGSILRTQCSW
jgi:hypothetical protein